MSNDKGNHPPKISLEYYPDRLTRKELTDNNPRITPEELPVSTQKDMENPRHYIADDNLADALNVALVLGQPLLLTGEPGCGKTQFAYSAAHWLGFGHDKLLRINVKSITQATDFFYEIDQLRRFRDAQIKRYHSSGANILSKGSSCHSDSTGQDDMALKKYMKLGPLGEAILRATPPGAYPDLPQPSGHTRAMRSIVLVDEIDKATRDVPNDLLNNFENMEFEVAELQLKVTAPPEFRPVLIITSNSERNLPDAFLRRCVYYNIPFPGETQTGAGLQTSGHSLEEIIRARIGDLPKKPVWLGEAIKLFLEMRKPSNGFRKRPGTAELLNWLTLLHRRKDVQVDSSLKNKQDLFDSGLRVLIKNNSDMDSAWRIYNDLFPK